MKKFLDITEETIDCSRWVKEPHEKRKFGLIYQPTFRVVNVEKREAFLFVLARGQISKNFVVMIGTPLSFRLFYIYQDQPRKDGEDLRSHKTKQTTQKIPRKGRERVWTKIGTLTPETFGFVGGRKPETEQTTEGAEVQTTDIRGSVSFVGGLFSTSPGRTEGRVSSRESVRPQLVFPVLVFKTPVLLNRHLGPNRRRTPRPRARSIERNDPESIDMLTWLRYPHLTKYLQWCDISELFQIVLNISQISTIKTHVFLHDSVDCFCLFL